ncbi:hypothetical protein RHGRI_013286 [Rhododendron griersonianum]|uniref:Uncharacterized protein n=1 Tax=Rhododendron griersonianum TaxID=479676 RepID=A0AAV6K5E0_9ERIC|nr:hypothetical protein RHGRI_013286 [Rhododendron griersonianum]
MPDHHPPRSLPSASLFIHAICTIKDHKYLSRSHSISHCLSDCYRLWTRTVFNSLLPRNR